MNEPSYEFTVLKEAHRFGFLSTGWTAFHKAVIFFPTKAPGLYNLVLADILPNGELDIYSVSDNGDMQFILATVYRTIKHFLKLRPEAVICFTGSTTVRTRLYQIALARELNDLGEEFNLYGMTQESNFPEEFCKGRTYKRFFICKKSKKLDVH